MLTRLEVRPVCQSHDAQSLAQVHRDPLPDVSWRCWRHLAEACSTRNGRLNFNSGSDCVTVVGADNFLCKGTITVWLTSCLTGLDLTKQVNLLLIQHKQSSWIQTNKTGRQPYSDTSPYEVNECSLQKGNGFKFINQPFRLRLNNCYLHRNDEKEAGKSRIKTLTLAGTQTWVHKKRFTSAQVNLKPG